jgi:hypothetical protein
MFLKNPISNAYANDVEEEEEVKNEHHDDNEQTVFFMLASMSLELQR